MTATITTNPTTGIEYYEDGPQEGQSVKLFVAVTDGQVRNPAGSRWPFQYGRPHDQPADYYELVPFTPVPFDPELFHVDDTTSGWNLVLKPGGAPDGHPKGTYVRSENIKRRTIAELKILAKGYADRYNAMLWPQENGYTEKLQYAEKQVAANNRLPQFTNLIARHEALLQASFHNDARLAQLYSEIEAAGNAGPIDFVVSQMATTDANGQQLAGWVNGIEE
jgi:hypothetical protein